MRRWFVWKDGRMDLMDVFEDRRVQLPRPVHHTRHYDPHAEPETLTLEIATFEPVRYHAPWEGPVPLDAQIPPSLDEWCSASTLSPLPTHRPGWRRIVIYKEAEMQRIWEGSA